jgi:hypothetical protein
MLFPKFYLDEDNYEDYRRKSLQEVQEQIENERIFVGSGEDAPTAWERASAILEHANG